MFRLLYERLLACRRQDVFESVLCPAVEPAQEALTELAHCKEPVGSAAAGQLASTHLWSLYALSRVSDLLLLSFQTHLDKAWTGPRITREQYSDFFTSIGCAPIGCRLYSPFYHEIVSVLPSEDPTTPVEIVGYEWPGLMFGEMLFARAGVRVAAGDDHLDKEIAENSTLYFAYRRLRRPTEDLSVGWGSNSQWRTSFRRDYRHRGLFHFNIDGSEILDPETSIDVDRHGLTFEERLELCKHRCFVRTSKTHSDLWPYDWRHTEPIDVGPQVAPAWLPWNDQTVRQIAERIYSESMFELLPILADALEEAGCTDTKILSHCRGADHPVDGCWVIDLIRSERVP